MDAAAGMSWFPGAPDGNSAHRAQEPGAVVRHQTGAQGHLRHGVLDPLAGLGRRHGGARARRQRLRRRRRGRLRAAGGRAAPERARRRGADGALQRRARAGHGGRRPGAGAGGGQHRPLPRARPGAGARQRPAARLRARRVRRLLLAELGTIGLREALDAAIGYAEGGYPVVPQIAATVARVEELFRHEWTGSAELWLAGGGVPRPGGRLRNPALAATWRRLLAEAEAASSDRDGQVEAARAAFYEGFVAEA